MKALFSDVLLARIAPSLGDASWCQSVKNQATDVHLRFEDNILPLLLARKCGAEEALLKIREPAQCR